MSILDIFSKTTEAPEVTQTPMTDTEMKPFYKISSDPDEPIKLQSWNICIKFWIGNAGASVQNSKTFKAKDQESALADAMREMMINYGENPRKVEILECFEVN